MPRDNGAAAPIGPYVQFAEGMSEEEVQQTMASLVALSGCFNTLMEKLEETADAPSPPEESKWHQEAIEIAALQEAMGFLITCDPPRAKIVNKLFGPILRRLIDDLARKRSVRPDGVRQKPADYVLMDSIWKADCAAAADVLICTGITHKSVEAWLKTALVRNGFSGIVTARRVIDWRDETVERLPTAFPRRDKTVGLKKPLDVMAMIFMQRRPMRERLSQDEAERLADEWLRDARLNVP
jgi:hypothetical protein